ncbi:hypothetical protein IT575_14720 [bacterium]|nr:hypothetical protein [bacterium]
MNWLLRTISGCDPEEAILAIRHYWLTCRPLVLLLGILIVGLSLSLLNLQRLPHLPRLPGPFLFHPDSQGSSASDLEEAVGYDRNFYVQPSALIPLLILLPLLLPPAWRAGPASSLNGSQFARSVFAWSLACIVLAFSLLAWVIRWDDNFWGWETVLVMLLNLNPLIPFVLALSFQSAALRHWRCAWLLAAAYTLATFLNECVQWAALAVDMSSPRTAGVEKAYSIGAALAIAGCVALLLRPRRAYWAYLATLFIYCLTKLFCLWYAAWVPLPVFAACSRLSLPAGLLNEDDFVWLMTGVIK